MGHSNAELEREVGAPTSSDVFQLTRESGRLQLGYWEGLSRFAPTAAGEALPVKEMLWKGRFSTRVAWLRRDASGVWRVFATLGWRADVAF